MTATALQGSITTHTACDGSTTVQSNQGFLRIGRSGDTAGPLSVDVTYGGSLTPGVDYESQPDPVEIASGSGSRLLAIEASRPGTITVAVEAGPGYTLGDPTVATATFTELPFASECPTGDSQTIGIGETPEPIDVWGRFGSHLGDAIVEIEGTMPPGLTFLNPGTWQGAATTAGTFRFTAKYCVGAVCAVELPITIVVTPGASAPAPPAIAVPREADYTG